MYRTVEESFWTDPSIKSLPKDAKLLFLYFITNPHSHFSGIYYLPISFAMEETNLKMEEFQEAFDLLLKEHVKHDLSTNTIWIKNMARYQINNMGGFRDGKKIDTKFKGIANQLKNLHGSHLVKEFLAFYEDWPIPFQGNGVIPHQYPIDAPMIKGNEYETEDGTGTEKKQKMIYTPALGTEIISYLNKKAETHYKTDTEKTIKLLRARCKDGFTKENFFWVIDIKTDEWKATDMEKYLRPETLFGNKFESYLNQKPKPKGGLVQRGVASWLKKEQK